MSRASHLAWPLNSTPFLLASTLTLPMCSRALHHLQCYLFHAFGGTNVVGAWCKSTCARGVVADRSGFCGIQEHPWLGYGQLKAKGCSFFYSGHRDLAHEDVALVLSLSVTGSLLAWLAVSPCLMWAQLQLKKGSSCRLWCVMPPQTIVGISLRPLSLGIIRVNPLRWMMENL
jgi:hypothetical protein